MNAQQMDALVKTMESAEQGKSADMKNGQKRAFLGLPGFCPDSAQESFSTTTLFGDSPNENSSQPTPENDAFSSVTSALKIAEKEAEKELKQQKLLAAQVKAHLSKASVREKIVAFMRFHDGIPNATITACLMAMIRQYSPGKAANAKDIGAMVASSLPDVSQRFVRDDVFGLLVSIGLIESKQTSGFVWADLAARKRESIQAVIGMAKRAAQPAFPELYDEQRKYAAAVKANDLAKKRADIARQTAAMVASTDTVEVMRRDSNTKVIIAAVAAALFAGGVLVAKYGSAPTETTEIEQEEYAPAFNIEQMLRDNTPGFDDLPLSEQARMVAEAEKAFAE